MPRSRTAQLYIGVLSVLGWAAIVVRLAGGHFALSPRFLCYCGVGLLTTALRVALPAITETRSVAFLLILFGLLEFNPDEALLAGVLVTTIQCLLHPRGAPRWLFMTFEVAAVAIGTVLAGYVYSLAGVREADYIIKLAIGAVLLYGLKTSLMAAMVALKDDRGVLEAWRGTYLPSAPYYVIGALVAGVMGVVHRYVGWQTALFMVPVLYLIYRSYGQYLGQIADESLHADEMSALHLRTIEALALAIEAKDHTTHDHLSRVQVYSVEIGKAMGLEGDQLEALRTASLLHDIGKLAVPEHIVSKPGRLTPGEFEKMKIHPQVGAEIIERVQFPYPVVPIVRSHHERWDGTGYPEGLSGDQIPLGARILSAVNRFNAFATARTYRRAYSLERSVEEVKKEAGTALDPAVVEILCERWIDFERKARERGEKVPLSTNVKITRGLAPAAGFERSEPEESPARSTGFLELIAAARQEVQSLFELAQDLGNSLSVDETLSVLAARLRRMVPCDAMAIYVRRDNVLVPEYATGEDVRLFSSLRIPVGQGLSGWVAENRKPIINGNPSVEPGYLNDPAKFSKLRSALAVPLEGQGGTMGVLSLYRLERDAFTRDHLRILLAISSKVALSIENAIRYRQAEDSATVDYLTTLPNARALFLHVDCELSRAKEAGQALTLLVCDLDGFKQVNDRFGHLEGNRLLRLVARGLKEECREYDFVARMGGDEFVVVIPGLGGDSLGARLERFRKVATVASREVCGAEMVGLSVGTASYPRDAASAEELLAEADRRMYVDKAANKARMNAAASAWEKWPAAQVQ